MFYSGDNIGAVVADIGSHACRIGFAGEDTPRAYLPTVSTLHTLILLHVLLHSRVLGNRSVSR